MKKTDRKLQIPSFAPRCSVCQCVLEDCGFPLPSKGVGYCPQGMCHIDFEVDIDENKVVKDKNGNLSKAVYWKVGGVEQHA